MGNSSISTLFCRSSRNHHEDDGTTQNLTLENLEEGVSSPTIYLKPMRDNEESIPHEVMNVLAQGKIYIPKGVSCDCAQGDHSHPEMQPISESSHTHALGDEYETAYPTSQLTTSNDAWLAQHIGTDITPPLRPLMHTMVVGPLDCNCVIIADPETKDALVVDPGGDGDLIIAKAQEMGVTIKAIVVTHGHFDHFLSAGEVREATGAPVLLHAADRSLWGFLPLQLQRLGIVLPKTMVDTIGMPDAELRDGQELSVLGARVIHTPGHTRGSCAIHFPQCRLLLAGDTLFRGSVGRTDLLGGDEASLRRSILQRLYVLPDATHVICGHGPATSIGREKHSNSHVKAGDPIT